MQRIERLLKITHLLSSKKVTTARQLAASLCVSERTIYRDIQTLTLSNVPILGEPGLGYQLMKGYQVPPIMFNQQELSALLLGARFIEASADSGLVKAASEAIKKIGKVIPDHLQKELKRNELFALDFRITTQERKNMQLVRESIYQRKYIKLYYTDEKQCGTERLIRPLGLFYWGKIWTMVAWCELREDFRQFRVDRIQKVKALSQRYEEEKEKSLTHYLKNCCNES